MPNSKPPSQHPLRDSWLPRQSFLQPNTSPDDAEIEDLDLAHIDENPLVYFLTPTPSSYATAEDGGMEFDMDFDAGIEDAKHPPPIVRSVSPSSLGGLSLPPGSSGSPRPPTPPRSPATPDLDFDYLSATPDDDHEQYDYLHTPWPPGYANAAEALAGSPRRRLRDKFRGHAKQDPFFAAGADTLALPGSPLGSSPRGRAASRSGLGPVNLAGASSSSGRARPPRPARLSPHAWREPSPDVWAIEEETQEELNSSSIDYNNHNNIINNTWMAENGFIMEGEGHGAVVMRGGRAKAVDIPAAKPKKKKKVRFALPALEDDGRGLH